MGWGRAAVSCALILVACSSDADGVGGGDGPPTCIPGESRACAGPSACEGFQVCNDEGTLDPCVCGAGGAGAGGQASGGAPNLDGGGGATAGAGGEGGEGGQLTIACDPITQEPCEDGSRCAWVKLTGTEGEARCLPDGGLEVGQPCAFGEPGEDTGVDDCSRGNVCVSTCKPICDVDPDSCGTGYGCTRYQALFGVDGVAAAGVCEPLCDPLSQTRSYDGAAQCGGGLDENGHARLGCYGTPSRHFTCVKAGDPAKTMDAVIAMPITTNACAPGFQPWLRASTSSQNVVCSAFCRPGETSTATPSNAGGVAPFTCAARGGTANHECKYVWYFGAEDAPPNDFDDTLGVCVNIPNYQYDADSDGTPETPIPSCKMLSPNDNDGSGYGDNVDWGCGPRP